MTKDVKLTINGSDLFKIYQEFKASDSLEIKTDYESYIRSTLELIFNDLKMNIILSDLAIVKDMEIGNIYGDNWILFNVENPEMFIKNVETKFLNDTFWRDVLQNIKPDLQWEIEGEEQEEEIDYSKLSSKEIDSLINQAIDSRNFSELNVLRNYIKESYNNKHIKRFDDFK